MLKKTLMEDGSEIEEVDCYDPSTEQFVHISGSSQLLKDFHEGEITSGTTTLMQEGAYFDDDAGSLIFPDLANVQYGDKPETNRKLAVTTGMSSAPSEPPSFSTKPSFAPSETPSFSSIPSSVPSETPSFSTNPSSVPSQTPSFSSNPSSVPSQTPSFSTNPSKNPSETPSLSTIPSSVPSKTPSLSSNPSYVPNETPFFQ
jgi:hypothetical protein